MEKERDEQEFVAVNFIAAVRGKLEALELQQKYDALEDKLKTEFGRTFEPIPHVDDLPNDVYCRIKLRDATKTISKRTYGCPRKYREAWKILIDKHVESGKIRLSNSEFASPSFIIPKTDPTALPRWVNDYRELNSNVIIDSHPLPRVDDILADCAKGKIWAVIDMTDSFFQTRVHPDDIHLTAVTTPFGLYEWTVMPMGYRNAPSIQQRRVIAALRKYLGKICHIYLDDIIVCSQDIVEHEKNVQLILQALIDAKLYCNKKKSRLFSFRVNFLGHMISQDGIEADEKKAEKIENWPVPTNATETRAFLGLMRYLNVFLPKLAVQSDILLVFITKETEKKFPEWRPKHQLAFDTIKAIVTSWECLTSINHENMGQNKIFVTTDASDRVSGAVLSFGPTWESARPVAYNSMTFKGPELNYPVYEKELLAIMRALRKWKVDLLGSEFFVYTDHKTLLNFDRQKDMS